MITDILLLPILLLCCNQNILYYALYADATAKADLLYGIQKKINIHISTFSFSF
jgi:hypothetical protein